MATRTLVDDFLTVAEAADQLHVAPSTIRRWIREGDLPAYRIGKRRVAIRQADLVAQISPAHKVEERGATNKSPEPPAIRPLTPEERRRGLEILEELKQIQQRMLEKRGGKPFSPGWQLINDMRDERTRELSELS
ncbi:MAG: helix-turn-helix domain-containing protein [Thermomicrobiales bacterium]